jgi:tetratricopeptide (TPR) repeat protein
MFTHLGLGNFEKCIETCNSGVEVAKRIGVPPVQYATIRAIAYIRWGRFELARRSLEEEIADEAHRFGRAFRDTGYGMYYLETLSYGKAIETLKSSIIQAADVGRAWLVNSGKYYLGLGLIESGSGSVPEIEEILNHFDPTDTFFGLIFGQSEFMRGDFDKALEFAEELEEYSRDNGRRYELASALLLKGQSLRAKEMFDDAEAAIEAGIKLAVEMESLPILWRLRATRAKIFRHKGDEGEAIAEFERASKSIGEMADNISEKEIRNTFLSDSAVAHILGEATGSSKEIVKS